MLLSNNHSDQLLSNQGKSGSATVTGNPSFFYYNPNSSLFFSFFSEPVSFHTFKAIMALAATMEKPVENGAETTTIDGEYYILFKVGGNDAHVFYFIDRNCRVHQAY